MPGGTGSVPASERGPELQAMVASQPPIEGCSSNEATNWKPSLRGFLIDMDGVIYRGQLIPRRGSIYRLPARPGHSVSVPDQQQPADAARRGDEARPAGHRRRGRTRLHLRDGDRPLPGPAKPDGTAFVIGEGGLLTALHQNGYAVVDHDPDYVVVGEGRTFNLEMVEAAVRMILARGQADRHEPRPELPDAARPASRLRGDRGDARNGDGP